MKLLVFSCLMAMAAQAIEYSPILNPLRMDREINGVGLFAISATGRITGFLVENDGLLLRIHALGKGDRNVSAKHMVVASGRDSRLAADIAVDGKRRYFGLSCQLDPDCPLTASVSVRLTAVEIDGKAHAIESSGEERWRPAVKVRDSGDEGSKGHRIPALVQTTRGSLIAAYDVRYTGMRDLQGHMDIGLNRSTDGGRNWGSRIIALDMGQYAGLPEAYNGVSDAALLVDRKTGRIFCFGLWMHGVNDGSGQWVGSKGWTHQWRKNGSMPGLDIKGTSQFLMSVSDDDGLTWSKPTNITRMVKRDPNWRLYAPAPGNGITLQDGTLVVPTQGLTKDAAQFSTVMISKDRGETWQTGLPANDIAAGQRANECAVVQLDDGSLMLNSRDPSRKKKRGVYVTRDLGETWTSHPTDHKALIEPTCMASLIRHEGILLFSNPNSASARKRMTIKASLDEGMTWPRKLLLDEHGGAYSCLTQMDAKTVGILYESSQAQLLFQAIPIRDILRK